MTESFVKFIKGSVSSTEGLHYLLFQMFEKNLAGLGDLAVGEIEFTGVPWVRDFAGAVCEVPQAADLVVLVGTDDPFEVAAVIIVHYDDVVVMFVFRLGYLVGAMSFAWDAFFMEQALHRRIYVVLEFLC